MGEYFDKLTPAQLTAVMCTVSGVVALVVFIVSIWSYQVRALADQTALQRERLNADIALQKEQVHAAIALKQELVKRNLPAGELRLALEAVDWDAPPSAPAPRPGSDDAEARVLKSLVFCGDCVAPATVEETIALVRTTDPAALRTLADVLDECLANDQGGDTVYAVARAFCKSAGREPLLKAELAAEAAAKPDIDLQFDRPPVGKT